MASERLPLIRGLLPESQGWGFFLCTYKDLRQSRAGDLYIAVSLQDKTGVLKGRVLGDVSRLRDEFEDGDFVRVEGRTEMYNAKVQLLIDRLRRVNPDQDRAQGFREEDCVLSAPRSADEMWTELQEVVQHVRDPFVRELLLRITAQNESRLRIWPAAQTVHHAYRSGLLEHILSVARAALMLGTAYSADRDLLTAGAILHDIGKLEELDYDHATRYSREGNLVGHVTLGTIMVRNATSSIADFPDVLRTRLEHLIVSHHGRKEFGAPIEPMTIEAIILSTADDLDSKLNQVKQALAEDGEGEFTAYHRRLGRVLWRG